jgi:hypothetical protein|tara:strand:+ start:184 stop:396 length:213 start_codon:yes stop_codon:yes gene_type:complete
MEEIRGKTLKEWKDYCKNDNVPINTMKYITCLEERIEALTIPVVVGSYSEKQVDNAYDKGFKDAMVKYRK